MRERAHHSLPDASASRRALMLSFLAVMAFFLSGTVMARLSEGSMEAAARSITSNAAPSIRHLAEARGELRTLNSATARLLDVRPEDRPQAWAEVEGSWVSLRRSLDTYFTLPTFPGERELWHDVEQEEWALGTALPRLHATLMAGNLEQARQVLTTEVQPLIGKAQVGTLRLIDFNADAAERLARDIAQVHRASNHMALLLNAVAALCACIVGALAVRELRRVQQLYTSHSELLQERADELEQFSGRVAHDILSPLGAVALALELSGKVDDLRRPAVLQRGAASLRQVRRIVDGLLEFARAGARPEPGGRTDVAPLFADLAQELMPEADQARVTLRFEPAEVRSVGCTAGILTSVLTNLVRNALKYMGQAPERRVVVRAIALARAVRFEVEDTGPGLLPGLEKRIFEPYVRGSGTGQPGIGLGLATVKRVAEAHGGAVGVRSVVGQGALFWVELPCAPATVQTLETRQLSGG